MAKRQISDSEILAQIPAAIARERQARADGFRAISVRYQRATNRLKLELTNGVELAFPVESVTAVSHLSPSSVAKVQLDHAGACLRWEVEDIDVSVAGLILACVGPRQHAQHWAVHAGRSRSRAKSVAARKNGAKGGRPKKVGGKR
jgi:Protein of unknown function (DUF2442)